jgi:hypothetical protein
MARRPASTGPLSKAKTTTWRRSRRPSMVRKTPSVTPSMDGERLRHIDQASD